jgi:hypothetical protein
MGWKYRVGWSGALNFGWVSNSTEAIVLQLQNRRDRARVIFDLSTEVSSARRRALASFRNRYFWQRKFRFPELTDFSATIPRNHLHLS